MRRPALALACISVLAAGLEAQHRLDPARLQPVRSAVRDAGTLDVTTGRWTRPGQRTPEAGGVQTIFDNTCTWVTQGYYAGFAACEQNYDEGRVPSTTSPSAPLGAEDFNAMDSFQVSYCTYVATASTNNGAGTGYAMEVGFWDNLNGDCIGGLATSPGVTATATAYFNLAGLGLPGSTANGFQACWIVTIDVSNTGWTMASDGDGLFSNDPTNDKFNWSQAQLETATHGAANPDGFLISGEPATGGFGACSYTIACGTDALFGNTCGTGLDAFDASWINVDGIAAGSSVTVPPGNSACTNSVAQYGMGSNCYLFGGYPTNPFASYWLRLRSERQGGPGVIKFCSQTKPTSVAGCFADLDVTDTSLTPGTWVVSDVPLGPGSGGTSIGIFIYQKGLGLPQSGFSASIPFGTLCLNPFLRSSPACAPVVITGGGTNLCHPGFPSFSPSCNSGALGITLGESVNAQCWYRDPAAVGNANFTNAVYYTVGAAPPSPPIVTGFSPSAGGEGTVLTITGGNFGPPVAAELESSLDLKVLLADGVGFADVNTVDVGSLSSTVFAVGQTGTGPITVIHGTGVQLPDGALSQSGISSTSSHVQTIPAASGTSSAASFSLTPLSGNTLGASFGTPFPGNISLPMASLTGDVMILKLAFKLSSGDFRTFELRLDFSGTPTAQQRADHLVTYINTNFGTQGLAASTSGTNVRISMAGATYGGAVVKGQ